MRNKEKKQRNAQTRKNKVADSTIAIPQLTEIEDGEKTDTN